MQTYTYASPKIKDSTKLVEVLDERGHIVCAFKRVYKNICVRLLNYWQSFDWYTQIDVYDVDGIPIYTCKKHSKWFGHPSYELVHHETNERVHITYTSRFNLTSELLIEGDYLLIAKSDVLNRVQFFYDGKEVAMWQMKATQWFKTTLVIQSDSPIQQPAFFIALAQCIFHIGN